MEEWEQALRDPVVERGFFDDLVRQAMTLDLSELMEPAPPRKQRSGRKTRQEKSIAAALEKEAVLAMVDQMEADAVRKEAVLAHPEGSALLCTHDENVSICYTLSESSQQFSFWQKAVQVLGMLVL